MILQLDRVDCLECDTSLDLISEEGICFPKKTIYRNRQKDTPSLEVCMNGET
jgi:hypothetical protein